MEKDVIADLDVLCRLTDDKAIALSLVEPLYPSDHTYSLGLYVPFVLRGLSHQSIIPQQPYS